MIGTYAAVLAVCAGSLAIGQGALALCGARRWSWLSPAVGLALLSAVCWGTVRLPGGGMVSSIVVLALTAGAILYLRGVVAGGRGALRAGMPVALVALAAASLPFVAEGHFGILGTSFNPDMSQHLLAADRLAAGEGSQLLHQGYPLGPHAIAVALDKGLGIDLVQSFDGLTIAVAVLGSLTALAAFAKLPPLPRTAAALLVGIPYLVASYYAQGAFKETMQALFVLAFVFALRESTRAWRDLPLRFVPAALVAVGSVYTYSFPGLVWLIGIAAIWALLGCAVNPHRSSVGGVVGGDPHSARRGASEHMGEPTRTGPAVIRAGGLALLTFAVLAALEIGRMVDFHAFETFDPNGPGLGNLFGQIAPLEALGIWPSGDFRLAPGDGAAPAVAYYLAATFAFTLLLYGMARCWRRRETAVLAGLMAAAGVYVAARTGGTPYTTAKAIEVAAPLVTLTILLPLGWRANPSASSGALFLYLLAAGACSLLALANAPVGPASYSPALTGLRPLLGDDSTLVLAPDRLLDEEHGVPYFAWELRGGRVCIEPESETGNGPPPGVRFVIVEGSGGAPPFDDLTLNRRAGPYLLWEREGALGGPSPCPLIAVRQARQGPAP